MSKFRMSLVALALACSGAVQAAPVFDPGGSQIFFNNFENLYRASASCTDATCLATVAGDPTGYRRVITGAVAVGGGGIQAGDIFAGILDVQNIRSTVSGIDTWNSSVGDRFTGYFAQTVISVTQPDTFGIPDPTRGHVTLGIGTDPFGILAAGEMFRLYSDTPSFSSGGSGFDVSGNIALATAGTLWAGLGFGTGPDGYAYTHTDLLLATLASGTEASLALNVVNEYAGYNAGVLDFINDMNEEEIGGVTANLLCSPAEIASATISCTQLVGTAEIENNTEFRANGAGTSPWMYASNDPFRLSQAVAVPEPGTLALVGLALAGLGLRRRRAS